MINTPVLLGVDGGGTRTRARVASPQGETLATAEAGSSNLSVNRMEHARREISNAIGHALEQAKRRPEEIAALCLGISGADTAREREFFTHWARETYTPRVQVVNDGELVLAAATPDAWGIAVIAGTGSIAFGKTAQGAMARAGGWGYLIGDEGSGSKLGRDAVRAAMQAADGRGEQTALLAKILEYWNLREPSEVLNRVYRAHADGSPLRPAQFAALAPLVLRAAQEGDAVAQGLVERAAQALAAHVSALAHQLPFGAMPIPLALGGGLLVGSESLRVGLLQRVAGRGREFAPVGLAPEPVAGAVMLARRLFNS